MKLLIAEDELLCLNSLKELDWKSLGINTVLTAENGEKAYEIAVKEKPDVILSDIQMPKMNGLELADKLSVNLPESRFIILTAYNSFTYAQAAISSGVSSLHLKTVSGRGCFRRRFEGSCGCAGAEDKEFIHNTDCSAA